MDRSCRWCLDQVICNQTLHQHERIKAINNHLGFLIYYQRSIINNDTWWKLCFLNASPRTNEGNHQHQYHHIIIHLIQRVRTIVYKNQFRLSFLKISPISASIILIFFFFICSGWVRLNVLKFYLTPWITGIVLKLFFNFEHFQPQCSNKMLL